MKRWCKSKTLWFNAIIAGLTALEASIHLIQPYVSGNVYGWVVLLLTVGNAMLRIITSQGISLK